METNKLGDLFIIKLLNKLQQHSEDKKENPKDPEESWEDLVFDVALSALSLKSANVEDLEPVRNFFRKVQGTHKHERLLKEIQQLPMFKHPDSIKKLLKDTKWQVPVTHTSNPSCSGGRANSLRDPISRQTFTKEGWWNVGLEFKLQYCHKKKKKGTRPWLCQ
jgi:hypothetical protein